MDYQASTSSRKVAYSIFLAGKLLGIVFLCSSFGSVFAQTTTNPLQEEVTITADVLLGSVVYPDTPPSVPPSVIIDTSDSVIFKGLAYPESIISLLKNGVIVAEVPASPNGMFEIRLRNLNPGTYSFGLRAEDPEHLKSKLLLFTIFVSSSVTTVVEGIFIPPTITSDKIEVKKGEIITFLGRGAPDSDVRLSFHSDVELLKKQNLTLQVHGFIS